MKGGILEPTHQIAVLYTKHSRAVCELPWYVVVQKLKSVRERQTSARSDSRRNSSQMKQPPDRGGVSLLGPSQALRLSSSRGQGETSSI